MAVDDDNVIENDVVRISPDLSGFRRKLESDLKKSVAGVEAEIPVKLNQNAEREAVNYVAGLRAKYIKEQLTRTRNGNEQISRAQDQARQHELKQERNFQETLDRLHGRAADNELNRVRSNSEKIGRAREQANRADAERQQTQVRNLAEKLAKAEVSGRVAELERELSRVRSLGEKVEKAYADGQRAEREREAKRVRSDAEARERTRADAERAEREREGRRTRSEAEALEKQQADATVADRVRTNSRVRSVEESFDRTREQAQQANYARERSKYRNHQELIDDLHRQALSLQEAEERKASDARTKILDAENKRRSQIYKDLRKGPPQLIDYGGKGIKPMNLLLGITVALSPALLAMASSAVQASTSIAALGAAGIGAALGIGALAVAFQGIGDALALRKQVKAEELTKAANSTKEAATNADDLARAQRNLADAQRDEKTAYSDIHTARQEAIRDLQDLRQAVIDLDNQYRDDTLSVKEAKQKVIETDQNFFSTALDRERARQDLRNAQTRQSDTGLERKQKTEDLKKSVSKGIEKSDKVVAAKERARDARDRTLDAAADLKKQTNKTAGGIDKTSSAAAQLQQKLKDMSPAAREMYYWFDRNEEVFKRLQREISQKTLPGFNKFLDAIFPKKRGKKGTSTLEIAAKYAGQLGEIIGKYVGKIGEFTNTKLFRSATEKIQKINVKAFDKLGQAALLILKPLLRITEKAAPGFESLADTILDLATRFDAFIEKVDKSGALEKWFTDARVQAKKWYDIVGNILTLVKNVFMESLPAGDTLVTRFQKFTQTLADWSSNPAGQKEINDFFDKFANLPYGKIADFFTAATTLFAGFRTYTYLKQLNPILLSLGAFATANPEGAIRFMTVLGEKVGGVMKYMVEHPETVTALLGILAAAKVGKAIGFSVKIPALNAFRDALTSKFKVLDKFVGGGAKTATMNVQAGVVNVYGKGGGAFGAASKGASVASIIAAIAVDAPSIVALAGLAAVIGVGVYGYNTEDARNQRKQNEIDGATLLNPLAVKPETVVKNPIDSGNLGPANRQTPAQKKALAVAYAKAARSKAVTDEANKFTTLRRAVSTTGGKQIVVNSPKDSKPLQDYIEARKKSIIEDAKYETQVHGTKDAQAKLTTETYKSRTALSNLLQTYGATKEDAEKYAASVYDIDDLQKEAKISADAVRDSVTKWAKTNRDAKTDVDALRDGTVNLKTAIDKVTGKKVITVSMDGETAVFQKLSEALTYQRALQSGLTLSAAGQAIKRDQEATKNRLYGHAATGGHIRGPGTATSDSIPTMLSNGEYVMPTKTVQHYGLGAMEAMRQRKLPAYAAGGPVGWKFPVDISKTKIPDVASAYGGGEGVASGDVGVAEIAEATARAMNATTKQLVALIEAGLVESGLRNINFGDRDSVGFLQQRPSQGWGSVKQLLDPSYATRKFINAAKRIDTPKWSAGELAANVQRPRADLRYKYGERQADAVAVLNRQAPFIEGYGGGPADAGSQKYFGTKAGLVAFGRWLQARGYTVSENPAFGSVGTHSPNSQHYRGNAIDVNRGAGTSKREQSFLRQIIPEGARRGFRSLFMVPGHYNHAHFDLGPGHKNGGLVRKYDTGGLLPPGYSTVYNGTGKNETVRTSQQEKNLNGPVRIDPRDLAMLAASMGGGNPNINLDGRKVAELTNRYNYLPAGV